MAAQPRSDQEQFQPGDPGCAPQPAHDLPLASGSDSAGGQPAASQPPAADGRPLLAIGSGVRLVGRLRYLRTADPMPMLRPADLVAGDEIGLVVEQRPLDLLAVRFRRGTFLFSRADLEPAAISD